MSLSAPGLRDVGTKADVMVMMVAVSLMFTIISLHRLEKAREPGPPACRQSKMEGGRQRVKRELEIKDRVREG